MGGIAAPLLFEIALRIGLGSTLVRRPTILWHVALVRSPGVDQRAVQTEMLVRQQLGCPGLFHYPLKQGAYGIVLNQSVKVLCVREVISRRIVHPQSDEPAIQHVVAQLLGQQPFTVDAIQRL